MILENEEHPFNLGIPFPAQDYQGNPLPELLYRPII